MTGSPRRKNQIIGRWGEACAAEFLANRGFLILNRNLRTPQGEIDLLAQREDLLLFVEVKTRTQDQNGYPEEAVTQSKLEHMINSAEYYLQEHPEYGENWRIDVIAVTGRVNCQNPAIEWYENAV